MVSSKVALILCATLAISTALPLDLGNVLGGVVGSVGGVVNGVAGSVGGIVKGVTGLLDDVLGNVEDVLNGLTSTVSQLLQQIVQILKIPSGTNPLTFIQNLTDKLDDILAQLLGTVGSGVDEVVGEVNDLTENVNQILAQLIQILNIPQGVNVVGFLQNLLTQLEQILQQVLVIVSQLLSELLGQGGLLGDLLGSLNDLKLAIVLQKLVSTLTQIVDILNKANVGGQ